MFVHHKKPGAAISHEKSCRKTESTGRTSGRKRENTNVENSGLYCIGMLFWQRSSCIHAEQAGISLSTTKRCLKRTFRYLPGGTWNIADELSKSRMCLFISCLRLEAQVSPSVLCGYTSGCEVRSSNANLSLRNGTTCILTNLEASGKPYVDSEHHQIGCAMPYGGTPSATRQRGHCV